MGPENAKNGKKENAKMKIRKWLCRHAIYDRLAENPGWECCRAKPFWVYQKFRVSGCWPRECVHNQDGENPEWGSIDKSARAEGRPSYTQCPLADSKDGKCPKMNDDGSSFWCQQGEREVKIESHNSCVLWDSTSRLPHPVFGCSMFEPMSRAELLEAADAYMEYAGFAMAAGRKWRYREWFREMLKHIGAPKEIVDRKTIPEKRKDWRKRTKEENDVIRADERRAMDAWKKWYKVERRMIAAESGEE